VTQLGHIELDSRLAGRYRLEREIGHGAHGLVFLATDETTGKRVAVKRFAVEGNDDTFLRELSSVFDLRHPSIVRADSVLMQEGQRYLVYEYMELGSIRERMNRGADVHETLGLLRQAALGVAHAHACNVLHRDLKPENILVTRSNGQLQGKVTDFGVSVLGVGAATRSNTGSPAYMAPEQFYDAYDLRVDVYSLGVVLYEILCGRRPFGGSPAQIMLAHLEREVELPERIPPRMREVLARCLAKKPEQRFDGVPAFLVALDQALSAEALSLEGELWPLYAPDAQEINMTSSALLVHTGNETTRYGARGDTLEVHPGASEVLANGSYFAFRQERNVTIWSAQTPVRALRVTDGSTLALSARGTLAILHEGRLRLSTQGDLRRSSMLPKARITAVCFIGDRDDVATATWDGAECVVCGFGRDRVTREPLDRLWAHAASETLVGRIRGTTGTLVRVGPRNITHIEVDGVPDAFDGRRLYAVEREGALFTLDLATGNHAITNLHRPLKRVAAHAHALAFLCEDGTIDRAHIPGGEA